MGPQYASRKYTKLKGYTKNHIRKKNNPSSLYTLSPKCKQRDCLGLSKTIFLIEKNIVHYSRIDSLSLFFKYQI